MSYNTFRKDYIKHTLEEADCLANPKDMLEGWLQEALKESVDANAMTLSTIDANGSPESRIVLIQLLDDRGLIFFTNYESSKGKAIAQNPNVAVNFFWPWLERQVRVVGVAEQISAEESDAYFALRPRESQLGAWASQQSDVMTTRDELDQRLAEVSKRFEGKDVPRPAFWGGFLIRPTVFEFWQGRANRLHDRIKYTPSKRGWSFARLFP